jgi:Spy/CpxP family protein refolding chaperone
MMRFFPALTAAAAVALTLSLFTIGDLALGRITPAAAQTANGPAMSGGQGYAKGRQRFAKMLMSLNLSDGQKSQIRSIMADARAKNKTLTDPQDKRKTMFGAFQNIEAVLTPAQKTKLYAERAANKAHGGPPGGGNSGGGNPGGS